MKQKGLLINYIADRQMMIVGQKDFENDKVDLVTAFQGEEAVSMMKKLLGKEDKPKAMTLIVNWDFSRGKDKTILAVGTKQPGAIESDIINVLKGAEIFEFIKKLSAKDNL